MKADAVSTDMEEFAHRAAGARVTGAPRFVQWIAPAAPGEGDIAIGVAICTPPRRD
jgi:hypothetical protein